MILQTYSKTVFYTRLQDTKQVEFIKEIELEPVRQKRLRSIYFSFTVADEQENMTVSVSYSTKVLV